jgi:MFS family permease
VTLVRLATQRTFRSLQIRNYRLFFFGQLVSVSGTWMQQLAQDWLVLRLTDRPIPVGITTALQFSPVLLLGIWGGLVADRIDKRRLLLATQGVMGALALALGLLTATGAVRLWMIYLLALLLGCATSFDMPARQAFVTEMVGPDRLANAVGLNSAVFNSGRIIGPAAAGVLIGVVGIAPAFLANAFSYLAVIGGLLLMRPGELYRRAPVERSRGQVRDGLRYAWTTPTLRFTLLLMSVVATLGMNFRVTLPLLARFTFDGGPSLYGLLASMAACGSVVGGDGLRRGVAAGGGRDEPADGGGRAGAARLLEHRLDGDGQQHHPARLDRGDARPRDVHVRPAVPRLGSARGDAGRLALGAVRTTIEPAARRRRQPRRSGCRRRRRSPRPPHQPGHSARHPPGRRRGRRLRRLRRGRLRSGADRLGLGEALLQVADAQPGQQADRRAVGATRVAWQEGELQVTP